MARAVCYRCRRARATCLCPLLRPFETEPIIVILMHPRERHKRIGTGRMAHLCISNSLLFEGVDFTHHSQVNALIEDPRYQCAGLFPGPAAVPVSRWAPVPGRRPVVFVIDGTWSCARTILRESRNLSLLPQIGLAPSERSVYDRIRRQPAGHCISTIEAIHGVLEALDPGADRSRLMELLLPMVEHQESMALARRGVLMT